MNPEEVKKWEKVRAKGYLRYLLLNGLLLPHALFKGKKLSGL
jgi:hypothetical protein